MAASAASARAPPVVLSQTMPTWWPRAAWPLRDIEDMAEDAADRRAGDVHDPEGLQIGHGQNQRSETSMVSPGRSG